MKLTGKTAKDFLQQPDKGCVGVLIYGPDAGLMRERMQAIAAKILPPDDPFGRVELTEEQLKNDPALLADELAAFSLTGGRRMVLVRDAGDKASKTVEAALTRADGTNYLVVCAGELGPRSTLRQLFESGAKLAALPCYRDEAMDIQAVMRRTFDAAGIACGRDVMTYLMQHLGNDRGVTQSELDKIVLYLGEERNLSLEAAENLVGQNRDVTLDALCMEIASGNATAADALLGQSLREGVAVIALLRAVQRHLHRLYQLRGIMRGGQSAEAAVAALKPPVFFRYVQSFARQAESWPQAVLLEALELAAAAEQACKQTPLPQALLVQKLCADLLLLKSGSRTAAKAA